MKGVLVGSLAPGGCPGAGTVGITRLENVPDVPWSP